LPKVDNHSSVNKVSPLRVKNLAENEMAKIPEMNEENQSKNISPKRIPRDYSNERMSPYVLSDIDSKIENLGPIAFSDYKRSPAKENIVENSPIRKSKISSYQKEPEDEILPSFEEFHKIMKDVDQVNSGKKKIINIENSPGISKDQRQEYKSIQDTLKSLQELKASPYKDQIMNIKKSEQEMELDYSISSANFSRDGENFPLEDVSDFYKSVDKIAADETISMLTYKTPERNSLRSSWKNIPLTDKSIIELLDVYEKAKEMKDRTIEVEKCLDKIDILIS